MRRVLPCLLTVFLACAIFLAQPGISAARKKKRNPAPAAPRITPAMRAAALEKVEEYLNASGESPVEHPGALVPFFEQLIRMNMAETRTPVHIIHWGDSHTAADEWTGGLRDYFHQRFGNGGSGFSVAGHPFLGYRRFDARGGATTGWETVGGRSANGDGFFGLGGVGIVAWRAGQSVFLNAECDHLEVHYLRQPAGGRVALYDFDQRLDEFTTEGELGPGFVRYDIGPGEHRFLVKTLESKPVRLLGWVADRDSGVTYEALGLNGAEASVILKWNPEMLATYLQRRNPGLIVLAYGTNEASDPYWSHDDYEAMFNALLQRLRQDAPTASILVLGPGDRWQRYKGKWRLLPGIDRVVDAERAACRENGCAFWDTRRRIGGAGAMKDWFTAGLAQPDHVHFTEPGYHRLADVLFADLMQQFELYKKSRSENTGQDIHGKPNQDR